MNKLSSLTLLTAVLVLPACKTVSYNVAANAPTYAADAQIKVKPNKTGVGDITIVVDHLAPPKRIDKGNLGYAAWIIVDGQSPIKLGMLEYNEKKRRGELHASTPQKKFTIQISIEKAANSQSPTGTVILSHPVVTKL